MPRSRPVLTTRRMVTAVAALAVCSALAACGSTLDPNQVGGGPQAGGPVVGGGTTGAASAGGPIVDPTTGVTLDPGFTSAPIVDPTTGVTLAGGGGGGGGGAAPTGPAGPGSTAGTGGPTSNPTATGTGEPPAPAGGASCDGFKNGPGMSDTTINIGNAADVSGPAPGLFEQSQQATAAYVKYFNDSGSTICGRKLVLDTYDTKTDAGADQQAYTSGCSKDFAMVGSMGAFDNGGAATAQSCGIPDIRAINTTAARAACTTCYAAQPAGPNEFENAVPDFVKKSLGGGQKAAMLYLNAGAAAENAPSQVRLMTKRGMKFVYVQGIDTTDFNYTPYVQQMKEKGVETVMFIGANPFFVRMALSMQQNGFKPKGFVLDPTAYDKQYTDGAGDAAEGTYAFVNFVPFEEAASNPETQLYLTYLNQVSPGATPGFFGAFSWSASRLFVQQATQLGGKLTRESLIASMKSVDKWTSNNLHGPQPVGAKRVGDCWRFIQWDGSAWRAVGGSKYSCSGTTTG